MAFCTKCGAQVPDGISFCGSCGSPIVGAVPAAGQVPAAGPVSPAPPVQASAGMASNVAGVLTYLAGFITGIIFLVMDQYKNDKFVRFHAFQSIFYSVVWIGFMIVWGIITSILVAATYGGGFFGAWAVLIHISQLVHLALFVFWLFLMYKAYQNEYYKAPVIGALAAKQASV
jgi:uncharacterized membrane protein